MMARAMAVAERRGGARAVAQAERLEAALRTAAPRASVTREGAVVSVAGAGVLDDPALRWPGGLLR